MTKTTTVFSRHQVVLLLEIDEEFLVALEEEEIVSRAATNRYSAAEVERIRICHSLHTELGVNYAGLEVALQLLETLRAQQLQFGEVLGWLREELDARQKYH